MKGIINLIIFLFLLSGIISIVSFIGEAGIFLLRSLVMILPYIAVPLLLWVLYEYFYFKSKSFLKVKESINHHINKCNELNNHIEELKNTFVSYKQIDYGQSTYHDTSRFNFARPELKQLRETENTYQCSQSVLNNARQKPFKYICKYFNIELNEETLSTFESVLNNFSAVEEGKVLLKAERDRIVGSIDNKIPFLIQRFRREKLMKELGFEKIDFKQSYFPQYRFLYVSAGGNSSQSESIVLDIENLNRFINFLSDLVQLRKSIAGQRALMTSDLREKIKKRDMYTCKICNNSIVNEPNLLLEIDHIIPLAKNGETNEDNLQTLCWKCNRSKGTKILPEAAREQDEV